jgi:hypothetical protein
MPNEVLRSESYRTVHKLTFGMTVEEIFDRPIHRTCTMCVRASLWFRNRYFQIEKYVDVCTNKSCNVPYCCALSLLHAADHFSINFICTS